MHIQGWSDVHFKDPILLNGVGSHKPSLPPFIRTRDPHLAIRVHLWLLRMPIQPSQDNPFGTITCFQYEFFPIGFFFGIPLWIGSDPQSTHWYDPQVIKKMKIKIKIPKLTLTNQQRNTITALINQSSMLSKFFSPIKV